jgi:hypothetical protein
MDPLSVSLRIRSPTSLRSPLANTNAEREAMVDGGLADRGAVWEMEVGWPSGAVLRKKASNHHEGRWLKTVVLSVVEKARRDRVRYGPGR